MSGWVGGWVKVSLAILLLLENHPKIALNQYLLIFWTLLKVVSYYDVLNVLSMSMMGFQKKVWMGGWVGG